MQEFDQEPAFILRRTPYKENQYLLDILTLGYGRLRAIGRMTKQKTHRETENLAPFRHLHITGRRKTELLTINQSEIIEHFPLEGKAWLVGIYLNELILRYTESEQPDSQLFSHYQNTLKNPNATALRRIEWYLIQEQGLLPERNTEASHYQLQKENDWFSLHAAPTGYEHALIIALEQGELPTTHPQLKTYLQTLLGIHQTREMQSKNTALALLSLLQN